MKRLFVYLILLLTLAPELGFAQAAKTGQLPALIDRDLLFGDPEVSGAYLSPDGKFLSFIKPFNGTRNIWVKGINEPFDKARPMTNDQARPVGSYSWSRDGKYLLYVQDKGGDENFNVYAVKPGREAGCRPARARRPRPDRPEGNTGAVCAGPAHRSQRALHRPQ